MSPVAEEVAFKPQRINRDASPSETRVDLAFLDPVLRADSSEYPIRHEAMNEAPGDEFTASRAAALKKLEDYCSLQANWDGYGAPRLRPETINAARQFLESCHSAGGPGLHVVPLSSGNVQLEWHRGRKSLELEFESAHTIHYLKWDPTRDIEEENCIPVDHLSKVVELIEWVHHG